MTFEVASVRLTPRAQVGYSTFSPYGLARYTATSASLDFLVQVAYGIPHEQIVNDDKLGSQRYDVSAKAEDGVVLTYDALKPRLQHLLAERFKLMVHRDSGVFDGYALVVANTRPTLTPAHGTSEPGTVYAGGFRFLNQTLSSFASGLRSTAGRPVVDKTGIEGRYDFELRYARDTDNDSPLPSFFTALEQQFGLKLEPTKVVLDLLVIDRVQQIPTEN